MLQKLKNKALIWTTFLYLTFSGCNVSDGPREHSDEIKNEPKIYTESRTYMNNIMKVVTEEGIRVGNFYKDGFLDSHLDFFVGRDKVTARIKDYPLIDNILMGSNDSLLIKIFHNYYSDEIGSFKSEQVSDNNKEFIEIRRYNTTSLSELSNQDVNLLKDVCKLTTDLVENKKEALKPREIPNFYVPKEHFMSNNSDDIKFIFANYSDSSMSRSYDISGLDKFDYGVSRQDLKTVLVDNNFAEKTLGVHLGQYSFSKIDCDSSFFELFFHDWSPFNFASHGIIGKEDILISGKLDYKGNGKMFYDKGADGPGKNDIIYDVKGFNFSSDYLEFSHALAGDFNKQALVSKRVVKEIRDYYFKNFENFQDLYKQSK